MKSLPRHSVTAIADTSQLSDFSSWSSIPVLTPFVLVDGSGLAKQQTQVRIAYSQQALYIRFDCEDDDIWGTYTNRDEPLYNEEVVEIFIAPSAETPTHYFEFEVSPNSVLFDCTVYNPSSCPDEHFRIDETWNAEGLEWHAGSNENQHWWVVLKIPWSAIGGYHTEWRANFYRIERSRKSATEFSCWSATLSESFHIPARFGTLELV